MVASSFFILQFMALIYLSRCELSHVEIKCERDVGRRNTNIERGRGRGRGREKKIIFSSSASRERERVAGGRAGGRERDGLRRNWGERERVGGRGRDKYTERGREREREREGEENCFFFFSPVRERERVCGGREGGEREGRRRDRGERERVGGRGRDKYIERGRDGRREREREREREGEENCFFFFLPRESVLVV